MKNLPKYIAIKQIIEDKIIKDKISFGEQLPSENELMKEFQCSRHTIRQSLSALVNEGFITKQKGKGSFASFCPSDKSKTVAVLTTYLSDYIFPHIISGIEEVLRDYGYNLLIANTDNDKLKERQSLKNFLKQDIDGIIIEPTKSSEININEDLIQELEKKGVKIIYINSCYRKKDSAYVMIDDEKGGYICGKYLLDLNHKNIAAIFKSDDKQGKLREKGFLCAMEENKISNIHVGRYSTKQKSSYPYQYTKTLISKKDKPSAIVCYNDEIALEVVRAINDEGLYVPEDISVISFDDSNLAQIFSVKLTTIKHPKEELGRQAANFLVTMIQEDMKNLTHLYEPELVIRGSCGHKK